jgi:hypothetical protein
MSWETPQELSDEEAPGLPAERECLQRKSIGKFNTAKKKGNDYFEKLAENSASSHVFTVTSVI